MPLLVPILTVLVLATPRAALAQLAGHHWYDAESGVRISFQVDADSTLSGRITWLRDPEDSTGAPARDGRNPDPALRDRPILGLPMIQAMKAEGPGRWSGGTIYDARNGKTYRAALRLEHPDTLRVRGYVKVGFVKLGRTALWVREPMEAAR